MRASYFSFACTQLRCTRAGAKVKFSRKSCAPERSRARVKCDPFLRFAVRVELDRLRGHFFVEGAAEVLKVHQLLSKRQGGHRGAVLVDQLHVPNLTLQIPPRGLT